MKRKTLDRIYYLFTGFIWATLSLLQIFFILIMVYLFITEGGL